MTAESSKTLAGIGSILLIIPGVNIVGIILVLLGMKGLSEYYQDRRIFDNLILGGILNVVGAILSVVGAFFLVVSPLIGIPLLIVGFILILLGVRYFRDSLYALAERSGEHLFHTAGTLMWIGALLSIIFVGLFLVFVAYILAAVGFFTMKVTSNMPSYNSTPSPSSAPTANTGVNFCPNCGASVSSGTAFCSHCGKQI